MIFFRDEDNDSRRKGSNSNTESLENGTSASGANASLAFRRTRSPPPAAPTPHTWPRQEVLLETTV